MYCKWLLLVACFWGQVWQICDKFLSTPTTPTGYPPTSLFLDRDNPKKKYPGNQLLQELRILLGGCLTVKNLWGYCAYDEVHAHYTHACTRDNGFLIEFIYI
jgi:hypothetical protein